MSYAAPTIGPAGLTVPTYTDIINYYVSKFQSLYGQSVYLGNDSADFQLLSVLALAAADQNALAQAIWNNMSPVTAVGAGLSSLVALNGLVRKVATFSTCLVTLTGTPGAIVDNGVVQDVNHNLWNLPTSVTIGGGGTVTVTATAQAAGAINALASEITIIATPTSGWVSVTNASNVASVGQPVETDAQLRLRQALSAALPSITILAGTIAAVAAVLGVTRYNVLENFTNATDAFGNPAHSVTAVVEGGSEIDIATAIFNNRGIGPLTNGNGSAMVVTVSITDPNSGVAMNINFNRPTLVPIFVIVNAHLGPGGTAATLTAMKTAVVNYLNALQIGEVVTYGSLVQAAMSVNLNPAAPIAWVRTLFFAKTSTPTTITDVVLNFYEVAQGVTADVAVNSV